MILMQIYSLTATSRQKISFHKGINKLIKQTILSYKKIFLEFSITNKYFLEKGLFIIFQQPLMENLHKYWCFACSSHFQTQKEASSCSLCHSEAVQVADGIISDPSQFSVYQIQNQQQQTQQNQDSPSNEENNLQSLSSMFDAFIPISVQFRVPLIRRPTLRIIHFVNFNEGLDPFEQFLGGENGLLNLLNSLRQQGNLVPATEQEISRLQKVEKVKDCTVCQQDETAQSKTGYKLSCGHTFHIDCLDPWLERTNTCPTCRAHI